MNTSVAAASFAVTRTQALLEHVDLMFKQTTAVFGGNILITAISVFALWNFVDHRVLLWWAGAVLLLTFGRIALIVQYRRLRPPAGQAAHWAWAFAVTALLSGVLWGSMGVLFFDASQPLTVLYLGWVLAGMITAAVPSLSNFPLAYGAFALPATLPYAYSNFKTGGDIYIAFGIITVGFLFANLLYSRAVFRSTGESIRLRFENLALMQQLREAKDHAETANTAKTRFLAAASHDLRQPTHALGLFVSALERLLQKDETLGTSRSASTLVMTVARMKATLKSLGTLLTSLLDASRLEAGAVKVEAGTVRLQERFDTLQSEFSETAQQKGLVLRFMRTRLAVTSDTILLTRILSNFIANAVKYTQQGRVTVGCRRHGGHVEIQVHDTGVGIDPRYHEEIFQEFAQVGDSAHQREQGLGLGLAIVRRMAQLLGHAVGLRSKPGRGSVFFVRAARALPAALRPAAAAVVERATPAGATIVVIDDDAAAREAIVTLLETHAYQVVAAASIDEIATRLRARPGLIEAAMIIADYRLGHGVIGVVAIRVIQSHLARPAPAIIVTGDTSPDRIREVQASGYPLLHKPLDAETLLAQLRRAQDLPT